jgi:putative transposase
LWLSFLYRLSACSMGRRAIHPTSWRRECGGLKLDQAKQLNDLERENQRLRKAESELSLDAQILKGALKGKY